LIANRLLVSQKLRIASPATQPARRQDTQQTFKWPLQGVCTGGLSSTDWLGWLSSQPSP